MADEHYEGKPDTYWLHTTSDLVQELARARNLDELKRWASRRRLPIAWLENALAWLELRSHVVKYRPGGSKKSVWQAAPEPAPVRATPPPAPQPIPVPAPQPAPVPAPSPEPEEPPMTRTCTVCTKPGTRTEKVMSDGMHAACRPKDAPPPRAAAARPVVELDGDTSAFVRRLRFVATSLERGDLTVEDARLLLARDVTSPASE